MHYTVILRNGAYPQTTEGTSMCASTYLGVLYYALMHLPPTFTMAGKLHLENRPKVCICGRKSFREINQTEIESINALRQEKIDPSNFAIPTGI